MTDALDRIVPEDKGGKGRLYRHSAEGKDDMPVSGYGFAFFYRWRSLG